jgi:hypothetical protein
VLVEDVLGVALDTVEETETEIGVAIEDKDDDKDTDALEVGRIVIEDEAVLEGRTVVAGMEEENAEEVDLWRWVHEWE